MDANKSLTLSIVGKDETKQAFDSVNKNLGVTEKQAFNFGKTMDTISASLSSFGKKMSIGVTAPLVALGGFALQSGAQLDTLQGSYERMTKTMGINSETLLSVMKNVSKGTIADSDLLLAANKAMSLGVVKNTEEMATIMEIARVKGQTMGLSMTQAFGDLVTGLGRGSAMILDNLGITIKVGEVNEAYAKSVGKTVDQLSAQELKQALVNSVVNQGKAELQAMGEVTITSQEKVAQMTAKLTNLKAELGQQLLPYAVKFAELMSEWIRKFQELDPATKKIIVFAGAFLAVIGPLALVLSGFITVITTIVKVVGFLSTAITALIPIIAGISLPVLAVIAGIVALVAVGYLVIKNWETIKEFAIKIWGDIQAYFVATFEKIKTSWTSFWTGIKDFVVGIWNGIVEGVKTAINLLVGVLDLIFRAFGTDLQTFLIGVKDFFVLIWTGIAEATKLFWDGIVATFNIALKILQFVWDNTFGAMFSKVSGIFASVMSKVTELFAIIEPQISTALNAISSVWHSIFNGLSTITGSVADSVMKVIDDLKSWVGSAVDWLVEKYNKMLDLAKKIGASIGGGITNTINAGAKITGLATGGFAQPGRTYMVGENGPELFSSDRGGTITPNHKLGGGGTSITINISGNTLLDNRAGEKIGDMIIKRLKLSNNL